MQELADPIWRWWSCPWERKTLEGDGAAAVAPGRLAGVGTDVCGCVVQRYECGLHGEGKTGKGRYWGDGDGAEPCGGDVVVVFK
jgi:hypothetical protein